MGIDGGIRTPKEPALAVNAAEKSLSYPFSTMGGIIIAPTAATVPGDEPEMAAKKSTGQHGYDSQPSMNVSHKAGCKIHQPFGQPAGLHKIAGQNEHRDSQVCIRVQSRKCHL